jgi:SNF2 family DNA or RNA helicase
MQPLFKAQQDFVDFFLARPEPRRVLCTSDPGTGKTRASLEAWMRSENKQRLLVVAPLSILGAAWEADIRKFFPGVTVTTAHGTPAKRLAAMNSIADVVLINHDGVKWIADQTAAKTINLSPFSHLIVDEFSAFKHSNTQRGTALGKVSGLIPNAILLGGTPNSNEVTDIWFPVWCLDRGQRLSKSFFAFRSQVSFSRQVGPKPNMLKWIERPGAREWIADCLKDITFRVTLEECLDMPEKVTNTIKIRMPDTVMRHYREMERHSITSFGDDAITAVHAGSRAKKLLQILSGAVYHPDGSVQKVFNDRYELVMDLVEEREHCIIGFNWKHERDGLIESARKRGITYAVIDGDVPQAERNRITDAFERGEYRILIAHPKSAAHGFTWVRGTTTIWCSPTYDAEWYQQFNCRIYRAGQTQRTETIRIAAEDTCEESVYIKLDDKMFSMQDLLSMMCNTNYQRESEQLCA